MTFSSNVPRIWNSLPDYVVSAQSLLSYTTGYAKYFPFSNHFLTVVYFLLL